LKKPHGFVLMDMLLGLAVVITLAVLLAQLGGEQTQAARHFADARSAQRCAEMVLQHLQIGQPLPPAPAAMQVQIVPVSDASAVDGYRWCKVVVECRGQHGVLLGLVSGKAVAP